MRKILSDEKEAIGSDRTGQGLKRACGTGQGAQAQMWIPSSATSNTIQALPEVVTALQRVVSSLKAAPVISLAAEGLGNLP